MSDNKDEIIKELEGLSKLLLSAMARIADNDTAVMIKEGKYNSETEALIGISKYAENTIEQVRPFVMRAAKLKKS